MFEIVKLTFGFDSFDSRIKFSLLNKDKDILFEGQIVLIVLITLKFG